MDPKAISFTITGGTDVGRKRQRNEDSMRWLLPEPGSPESRFGAVLLVCDGMGGVGKGDLASRTAVEFFFKTYYDENNSELDTQARVQQALEAAHAEVRKAATSLGMVYIGTTAAGVVIRSDGTALVFNLGDSRVYLLRGETMTMGQQRPERQRGDAGTRRDHAGTSIGLAQYEHHSLHRASLRNGHDL
ncbi:MAG: hypothetical protein HND48_12435 [Chloroflexi bacterium]|nr:hypothetical protein [Chloroflexota bacterium]